MKMLALEEYVYCLLSENKGIIVKTSIFSKI